MKLSDDRIKKIEAHYKTSTGSILGLDRSYARNDIVAAIPELLAEREELIGESRKRMLALESLTCGGSEFVGDVERCVEYVRQGQESMRRGLGKAVKAQKARADEAEARLEAVLLQTPCCGDSFKEALVLERTLSKGQLLKIREASLKTETGDRAYWRMLDKVARKGADCAFFKEGGAEKLGLTFEDFQPVQPTLDAKKES